MCHIRPVSDGTDLIISGHFDIADDVIIIKACYKNYGSIMDSLA